MNGVKRETETVCNGRIMRFGGENLNGRSSEKVKECVEAWKQSLEEWSEMSRNRKREDPVSSGG